MSKCNSKNLKKRKDAEDNIIASNAVVESNATITLADHDKQLKLLEYKNLEIDTSLKKKFAYCIIIFSGLWSAFILYLVYSAAFKWWQCSLSDKVLIVLITQTLFLVLGLPTIVARYLFPKYKRLPRNLSAGNIRLRRFS